MSETNGPRAATAARCPVRKGDDAGPEERRAAPTRVAGFPQAVHHPGHSGTRRAGVERPSARASIAVRGRLRSQRNAQRAKGHACRQGRRALDTASGPRSRSVMARAAAVAVFGRKESPLWDPMTCRARRRRGVASPGENVSNEGCAKASPAAGEKASCTPANACEGAPGQSREKSRLRGGTHHASGETQRAVVRGAVSAGGASRRIGAENAVIVPDRLFAVVVSPLRAASADRPASGCRGS